MKRIELTQNQYALVDDQDFDWLNQYKWYFKRQYDGNGGYAARSKTISVGKRITIRMHKFIMNTPKGFDTDHINENKLDNRRLNLRVVNRQQNGIHRSKNKNNLSGYKGVHWHKMAGKWAAKIKAIHIGTFDNIIDAAKAYDKKAKELYGEFAKLNFN